MKPTDNLMTMNDIAAHLDVAYDTVRSYRNLYATGAHPFPEPVGRVGRSEVWLREQVDEWHTARPGRVGNPNWTKGKQRPA